MAVRLSLLLLAGWMWSPPAPGASVRWTAPERSECPSEHAVVADIVRSGDAPVDPVQAEAVVTFDAGRGLYAAELTLVVGEVTSTQRFVDPRCDTVADAVVLTVAIARDPSAMVDADASDAHGEEEAPSEPATGPAPSAPGTDAEAAPLQSREDAVADATCRPGHEGGGVCLGTALHGGVAAGTVINVRPTAAVAVSLLAPRWGASLRGTFMPTGRIERGDEAVDVWTTQLSLNAGPRSIVGKRLELGPIVGVSVDIHRAMGIGFDVNRTRTQAAVRGFAGLRAGFLAGRWVLGVRGGVHGGRAVTFRGPSGAIARLGPFGGEFGVLLERRFGPLVTPAQKK